MSPNLGTPGMDFPNKAGIDNVGGSSGGNKERDGRLHESYKPNFSPSSSSVHSLKAALLSTTNARPPIPKLPPGAAASVWQAHPILVSRTRRTPGSSYPHCTIRHGVRPNREQRVEGAVSDAWPEVGRWYCASLFIVMYHFECEFSGHIQKRVPSRSGQSGREYR